MASKKPAKPPAKDRWEFIQHHRHPDTGNYVTTIWYDRKSRKFESVLSDIDNVKFDTIEEAKGFLNRQ